MSALSPSVDDKVAPPVSTGAALWSLLGLACITLIFGGLGGWAATAPLASAVVTQGQVIVETNRKQVAHLEGGIVRTLKVRNGDRVRAGDVLLRLDDTQARTTRAITLGSLDELVAREARLTAERDGHDAVVFPDALNARREEPAVAALLAGQQGVFQARRQSLDGEIGILEQRVEQLDQEIVGLAAQRASLRQQSAFIEEEIAVLGKLYDRGLTTRKQMLELRREASRLEGETGALTASIARSEKAIGEARLEVIQRSKAFREQVLDELVEVQTKMHDLRERLIAAEDVLSRIDVRAPVDGVVVNLTVHAHDAVIRPGEPFLELVPADDRLFVQVQIRPQDVDTVVPGQPAEVRFLAFKQRTTPTLAATVRYVSADSLQDEHTGQPYFGARLEVSERELARLGDLTVQPGMPAEALIRTGERTALRYLVQPILDSMNRAWREE